MHRHEADFRTVAHEQEDEGQAHYDGFEARCMSIQLAPGQTRCNACRDDVLRGEIRQHRAKQRERNADPAQDEIFPRRFDRLRGAIGQVLTGDDDHYIVKYNEEAINNQAIAYKSQDDGSIHPLTGWALLEPVEQEELKTKSDVIEVVELKEALPTKGRVAFTSSGIQDIGLSVGDVVGFKENRDYRITIDGTEYYRTRTEDLLYVEEVHNG